MLPRRYLPTGSRWRFLPWTTVSPFPPFPSLLLWFDEDTAPAAELTASSGGGICPVPWGRQRKAGPSGSIFVVFVLFYQILNLLEAPRQQFMCPHSLPPKDPGVPAWALQEAAYDMELRGQDVYSGLTPVRRRGSTRQRAERSSDAVLTSLP